MKDFEKIQRDPSWQIHAEPFPDDIMQWHGIILGPDDSPWEGGIFKLHFVIPQDYPNSPPDVKFLSKMFHPNIYKNGKICLDILQKQWTPMYDIASILTSL